MRTDAYAGLAICGPSHVAADIAALTDRLHRACLTVAALPPQGPRGFYSTWPEHKRTWWDAGAEVSRLSDADIARRFLAKGKFQPSPADVDDALPALELLAGSPRPAWAVMSARAHQDWYERPGGWRAIGEACGISHKTARSLHWNTVLFAYDRTINPSTFCGGQVPKISRWG